MSDLVIPPAALHQFDQLAKLIKELSWRAEERAKASHARFNLFTTLLKIDDEERLHTRFLHSLLDPAGLHDCGSLFLDLFFDTLRENLPENHHDKRVHFQVSPIKSTWTAYKEASRPPYGDIDILLECGSHGIAIENKINAAEQPQQLARYATYLSTCYPSHENRALLYLTIDGHKGGSHDGNDYLRISYRVHILAWIEKCMRETYAMVPINQALQQYCAVVRLITDKSTDSSIMNNAAEFIAQNPNIIRYINKIPDAIALAKSTYLDQLANAIILELQPKYQVRLRANLNKNSFGSDANGALIITPPTESPLHNAPFEIWVEHIAVWYGLMIGIESQYNHPAPADESNQLLKRMNLILERYDRENKYHKADAQSLPPGTYWPTGWHNIIYPINNDCLADLMQTPLAITVAKVCGLIRGHIELLERVFIEAKSLPDEVATPIASAATSATP